MQCKQASSAAARHARDDDCLFVYRLSHVAGKQCTCSAPHLSPHRRFLLLLVCWVWLARPSNGLCYALCSQSPLSLTKQQAPTLFIRFVQRCWVAQFSCRVCSSACIAVGPTAITHVLQWCIYLEVHACDVPASVHSWCNSTPCMLCRCLSQLLRQR